MIVLSLLISAVSSFTWWLWLYDYEGYQWLFM